MIESAEGILLVASVILIFSVFAGKAGYRFGLPALLLFLGVGMLFGSDGLGIQFDNPKLTQFIGVLALSIILFSGGMDTKVDEIKPIASQGIVLATVGVLLTTFITGGFIYVISMMASKYVTLTFPESLLLAAVMSSTDSASVFSILRSKKQGLNENLRPLLELESGSNDPMAYVLTIVLIGVLSGGAEAVSVPMSIVKFVIQMLLGGLMGYAIGRIGVWTINRINLSNYSLYPVLLLAFVFFTFSFTDLIGGNGYLAVYLAGLVLGNNQLTQKRSLTIFFDGFTWLVQIVMFLTLGLLVNLDELLQPDVLMLGCLVGAFMMFIARPITVFACMMPFRKFTTKARLYVSWVGLRGAVPIIFATYPLLAGTEGARLLFNVVFLVTILSLLVQGTTVSWMANLLGLGYAEKSPAFGVDVHEDIPSIFTEVLVNESMLQGGATLKEINLPENTLVMMVYRDGDYFVPQGNTELKVGDKLLVISDRGEELESTYKDMGVDEVLKL